MISPIYFCVIMSFYVAAKVMSQSYKSDDITLWIKPSQRDPIALRIKSKLGSITYLFLLLISNFFSSLTTCQFHHLPFISEHAKAFGISENVHMLHTVIKTLILQLYAMLVPSSKINSGSSFLKNLLLTT